MPNPIKYSTGTETLALKKGNFYIGTGAVGKGPTSETGYYNGITPPTGGYTIYLNKESGGPSIYTASNDAQLISLTNSIAGQSYTGTQQCFNYFYGQTDKVLVNQDYPADYPYIVMDGLVLYLDAGITQSYPGSGTSWTDVNGLGPKNNGTLINGPTFNSGNGGSIVFDGTNDNCTIPTKVINASNLNDEESRRGVFVRTVPEYYPLINNFTVDFVAKPYQTIVIRSEANTNVTGTSGQRYIFGTPKDEDGSKSAFCISFGTNAIQIFDHGDGHMPCLLSYQTTTTALKHFSIKVSNRKPFLYINGDLVREGLQSSKSLMSYNSADIGANGYFYPGVQSDIALYKIYNRILSDSEILQNFNATKGRFGL
jgi:hypothetical protein